MASHSKVMAKGKPPLLDAINSPADIKELSLEQLNQLAAEIRDYLVKTITAVGGHLSSNLGVVELTLALHRVLDSPKDKIVWDVSHQAFTHKLLTGRRQALARLRQYGGPSGFTDITESPHDPFGAGHASTSISAALGIALGRDFRGEDYHVAAVIGDGALGGGMAFEALNFAGHARTRLMVILNDNGLAISPSVGALARLLNRVRFDPRYEQAKKRARGAITSMPWGEPGWQWAKKIKSGLERVLLSSAFWQELGFVYLGPVDGHDIAAIEAALRRACQEPAPILIHILTQKGKGYAPAEADAINFHGVSHPAPKSPTPTYSTVFGQSLAQLMAQFPQVVAITAAMLDGTGLNMVAEKFPQRVLDVGICEQHAVTMAAGLASRGLVPVVAIYSTFLQRAFDQIIHDVCIQNLPVVFALDRAGIAGEDGKTHQGAFDLSYLRSIPNMVVAAPKDETELHHLLYTGIKSGCPFAVRYPRSPTPHPFPQIAAQALPIGRGEVLRKGEDLALVAIGSLVHPALEAAERLAAEGVEATVVNARFAKPLDSALLLKVAHKTKRVLTLEENVLAGGFGSAVLELLNSHGVGARVDCLGLPDRFIEHGARNLLCSLYGLDVEGILNRVQATFPELFVQETRNGTAPGVPAISAGN